MNFYALFLLFLSALTVIGVGNAAPVIERGLVCRYFNKLAVLENEQTPLHVHCDRYLF
jgi:hypothetical protein